MGCFLYGINTQVCGFIGIVLQTLILPSQIFTRKVKHQNNNFLVVTLPKWQTI